MLFLNISAIAGEPAPVAPGNEKEKPKEPPLKYSAWCSFRNLIHQAPPPKPNPLSTHTRPESISWGGFGRRGQWATITLELKNTTEKNSFNGTATIALNPLKENDAGESPYTTTYHQEFEIGPQSEKQYRFSVLCPENDWNPTIPVQISGTGLTPEVRMISLHDLDDDDFILVVSESSGSFRYLATGIRTLEEELDAKTPTRVVAVVEPQELPSKWHDLAIATLIIIDGPPREKLSDSQWDALKSYAQAGGHILITAGRDPSRLKGAVENLAGITVREMVNVESLDEINPPLIPMRENWKLTLVDVTAVQSGNSGGTVKFNHKTKYVEMSKRLYGSGSVTFLPFSLSDPLLSAWVGRQSIPLSLLHSGIRGSFITSNSPDQRAPGSNELRANQFVKPEIHNALSVLRSKLDASFVDDTIVQHQPRSIVLSFLLIYLLCAVPGNYFIFGWFRRREVAWLAAPVWALSFSVLAYVVGYMGQTGRLTVNEACLLEAGAGQSTGISRTFLGLYAPHRDFYRIEFPNIKNATLINSNGDATATLDPQAAPGHLINASVTESRNIDKPELYLVDGDKGLSVERLMVQQRSTRRLEIMHRAYLGNGLDVRIKPNETDNSALDIELENNTGHDLYFPALIYEGKAVELGTSQAGDMLPIGAKLKLSGLGAKNYNPWKKFLNPTPEQTVAETHQLLFFSGSIAFKKARGPHINHRAEAMRVYLRQRMENHTGAFICAWMEGGTLDVNIAAGREAAAPPGLLEGVTVLLVPVAIKEDSIGITESARMLPVRYSTQAAFPTKNDDWILFQKGNPAPLEIPVIPPLQNTNGRLNNISSTAFFLELQVPENYRKLHEDGFELQLQLTLGVGKKPLKDNLQSSGEVAIEIPKQTAQVAGGWQPFTESMPYMVQSENPWTMPLQIFSLADFRVRADGIIHLRISVSNPQCPLELKNVEYRLSRR